MSSTQSPALVVLLDQHAHTFAKRFAAEQVNPQKGKQVYLNTLAVYTVHSYLKWLEIKTNLDQADSWNSGLRAAFNVADLVLPEIGKLECCPVLSGNEILVIDELGEDRIGYVAVQFSEDLNQAELLGFVPARKLSQTARSMPLGNLSSLEELIDTIDWHKRWARLWHILKDWQPPESLQSLGNQLNPGPFSPVRTALTRDATAERSITRGKLVTLASASRITDETSTDTLVRNDQNLILTLSVIDRAFEEIDIRLRVCRPDGNIEHLPSGLQIAIIDETGTSQMTATSREADSWMQLEFSCKPQEKFSVQMNLGDQTITEQFEV
ncbi:MAG: DUF1822 family protein [Oscillatoriales cyanobacterium RM2_1_1]|nr:DUF1822 family protein [Oscillatoriales cyanobacterium SM2_3_0]NJO45021.1 DUF1822 family protein [Oscillatoriales cyanobacterium RM2_1_1]